MNLARQKMIDNRQPLGTFFHMGSSFGVECLGLAGLDYLVVDTEHGPFDVESTADFVRAAKLRNITPFARIKDATRPSVLKMLDIGVEGLIVPNVHTVQEVRQLVEYGKYFPTGLRGVAYGRGAGWGSDAFASNLSSYFETCNRESLLIPQCETKGCLDNIDEIVGIEGVDGIFVGPFDLSVALGKPAVFDEAYQAAVAKVLTACKQAGKFALIYAGDAAATKKHLVAGFDSVTISMDTVLYMKAIRGLIAEIRN